MRSRGKHRDFCFLAGQLQDTLTRAIRRAEPRGREICGLILDNGWLLELVPVKNGTREPGAFWLKRRRTRRVRRAAKRLGHRVVGTFHSHPAWPAEPGDLDIAGADDGALMLIFSCSRGEVKLWRIRGSKAKERPFRTVEL